MVVGNDTSRHAKEAIEIAWCRYLANNEKVHQKHTPTYKAIIKTSCAANAGDHVNQMQYSTTTFL